MMIRPALISLMAVAFVTSAQAETALTPKDASALAERTGIKAWNTQIVRSSAKQEVVFATYQPPESIGPNSCKSIRSEFVAVMAPGGPKTTLMSAKPMLALRACDGIGTSDFRQVHGDSRDLQWAALVSALYSEIPALGGHSQNVKFGSVDLGDSFNKLTKSDLARFVARSPNELSAIFYSKDTRPGLLAVTVRIGSSAAPEVFVDLANGPDSALTKTKK